MYTLYRKYESPRDRPFETCDFPGCVFPPKVEVIVDGKRTKLLCEHEYKAELQREEIEIVRRLYTTK